MIKLYKIDPADNVTVTFTQIEPGSWRDSVIGPECGGPDAFSGITANPLIGRVSDYLVSRGGTTVLTEVPELFGAEPILMQQCSDRAVFDKTVAMINAYKAYYLSHGQPVYVNPSPGNKSGGITSLEDKAQGCTRKAGKSQVVDVIETDQRGRKPGTNLLHSPGNDIVAIIIGKLTSAEKRDNREIAIFKTGITL